jgi:hypothetical protein
MVAIASPVIVPPTAPPSRPKEIQNPTPHMTAATSIDRNVTTGSKPIGRLV